MPSPDCDSTPHGVDDGNPPCTTCEGSGEFTLEEPTEEQIDAWREEVQNDLTIVGESPV